MASSYPPVPYYIHVLMGIGTFLGFLLTCSFLFALGIFDHATTNTFFILGAIFVACAFGTEFLQKNTFSLMRIFLMQATLLLMVTGKIFIIMAASMKFSNPWTITIALGLCSLSTYFIYSNIVDRILFLLSFLLSLTSDLNDEFASNLPIFILFTSTIAAVFILSFIKNRSVLYNAINVTFIFYACLLTAFIASHDLLHFDLKTKIIPDVAFNFSLAGIIILFILYCVRSFQKINILPILFSCIGLLILSIISNTGILWGIALLIIGYQNSRRHFIAIGSLFLIGFLIVYYYNLSLPLDYKSYLLMGSGLFLLLTRAIMQYLKWDQ